MSALLLEEEATRVDEFEVGDGPLFEIVDGQKVELPEMSMLSNEIARRLNKELILHLANHDTGTAQLEILYDLGLPRTRNRRPDVSYVSHERWPKNRPFPYRGVARDVVPDLAVEVVSPTDFADDLQIKIDEYFSAGVREVWIVYCINKRVYVYSSPTSIRVVTATDFLEGGDVLPSFRVSVDNLFPPMGPMPTSAEDQ